MSIIWTKLILDKKRYTTSEELKKFCVHLNKSYEKVIRYLMNQEYLIRIFRGVFYVKTFEEHKLKKMDVSPLELISNGFRIKKIDNWYFALYSALKMNNVEHDYSSLYYVINDKMFRKNPIKIAGYKFKIYKIKPGLLKFGINTTENFINYSNVEKTFLDFIYVWKYNGLSDNQIVAELSEYRNKINKHQLLEYSNYYPKSNRDLLEVLF